MAITITSGLATDGPNVFGATKFPGFVKNPILAYKVNSNAAPDEIRARIYVEDTPYSNTYTFVVELKAFPDDNGDALFYIGSLFEEDLLQYDKPKIFTDKEISNTICRRVRTDLYEYNADDLVFIDQAYQNTTASEEVTIEQLSNGTGYIIIVDTEEALAAAPIFRAGGANAKAATLLYQLGDERWYTLAADHDYDSVVVEKGKKVSIYEGAAPALTQSDAEGVLLGGFSYQKAAAFSDSLVQTFAGQQQTFNSNPQTL